MLTDELHQPFVDLGPMFVCANRLQLKVYGGGHMLYFEDKSRAQLRDDVRKLIEEQ